MVERRYPSPLFHVPCHMGRLPSARSPPRHCRRAPVAAGAWPRALGAGASGSTALCQPRLARMAENQDSLRALRAETLRGLAGQREEEEARRDRGCWCCWLTVPVVLAVAWALPVVWESHLRPWHNAFTSALTDPYTLGGVAVTFTFALYGLLQCIDLGDK